MANNFDRAILDGTNMAANTLHSFIFAQLPQQQKTVGIGLLFANVGTSQGVSNSGFQ